MSIDYSTGLHVEPKGKEILAKYHDIIKKCCNEETIKDWASVKDKWEEVWGHCSYGTCELGDTYIIINTAKGIPIALLNRIIAELEDNHIQFITLVSDDNSGGYENCFWGLSYVGWFDGEKEYEATREQLDMVNEFGSVNFFNIKRVLQIPFDWFKESTDKARKYDKHFIDGEREVNLFCYPYMKDEVEYKAVLTNCGTIDDIDYYKYYGYVSTDEIGCQSLTEEKYKELVKINNPKELAYRMSIINRNYWKDAFDRRREQMNKLEASVREYEKKCGIQDKLDDLPF